ncbi:hypothetical protein FM076_15145 [Streptomyces albus subsp. chlorinus]|uniref:hypothetical protein n=1 Tax=Streptomyces albus TaxID=1888 RepID=UPI00156D4405|nr:hypothetical protein [Streptomyces albus]NSC22446.1 hypothetical protein [Streptomyces albus subsp. chlorinus]
MIGVPAPRATAEPDSSAINDLSPDSHGPARMQLAGQAPSHSGETGSDGQTVSDRAAWRKAAHDTDQLKRPVIRAGLQMAFNTLNTLFDVDGDDGDFECAGVIDDTLNSSWAEYANKVADRCTRLAGSMQNAGTMQHNNDEESRGEFDRLSHRYRDTPGR